MNEDEDLRLPNLMAAYQEGNLEAFEHLYFSLRPRLERFLFGQTFNRALTDDLVQETFLQIHRSRATYQLGRPVEPWAFAIARHVFLMSCRSRVLRLRHEVEAQDSLPDFPIPPEMEALGTRDLIQSALARVPPDRREPIVLHHLLGFSFGEIAAILGIERSTAKVRAHRGMNDLRAILGEPAVPGSALMPAAVRGGRPGVQPGTH